MDGSSRTHEDFQHDEMCTAHSSERKMALFRSAMLTPVWLWISLYPARSPHSFAIECVLAGAKVTSRLHSFQECCSLHSVLPLVLTSSQNGRSVSVSFLFLGKEAREPNPTNLSRRVPNCSTYAACWPLFRPPEGTQVMPPSGGLLCEAAQSGASSLIIVHASHGSLHTSPIDPTTL